MPCKNFQIRSFRSEGFLWLLGICHNSLNHPLPIFGCLGFFPTFSSSLCRNPTPNRFHTLRTSCQTAFPKGCSNSHSHQQRVRMLTQLPSSPGDGRFWPGDSGSFCREGRGEQGMVLSALPGEYPRPRTTGLTSPVPRTEPAEKKKSKQGGGGNQLSAGNNTHIHRLK